MNIHKIKKEYKLLLEYTYYQQGIIEDLIFNIKNFLINYYKTPNFNEAIADNFELNLIYLEKFYTNIENIINTVENITIDELYLPQAKIYNINDFSNNLTVNNHFILDFNK